MEVVAAAFERAKAAEPSVVIVGGEAGVGKTRLVEDAVRALAAADEARVLIGACVELGGEGVPFAPLVDHIRSLVATTDPEQLDAFLGQAREELARLLPELGPSAKGPLPTAVDEASRLFEFVLGVIARLSEERPLVLVFEDLHWADQSTLDLLTFLVRTMRTSRVLIVATYRSEELHRGHPLRPLLLSLERVRSVQRIELPPFTRAEVAAQLEAIAGEPVDPELVERVHERSEGNAFLAEELLGAVRGGADIEHLSPSLRDLLLARFELLDDDTRHVLRVVAVAGRRVPDALLAAVSGVDEAVLIGALRDAAERQLMVADDAGYAFRHALVREAVYDDMLPAERVRLHTAYGNAVEADPALAGDEGSAAAALAHHWYAAHDLPRALPAAVQAARHASAAFAPGEALRHLEWALEIWPQVPDAAQRTGLDRIALVELASATALVAGREPRALALVDEALGEVDRVAEPERAALLLERRSEAIRWKGTGEELETLHEAAALLPDEPSPARAVILTALARTYLMRAEMATCRVQAEQAAAVAHAVGDHRLEASALISLGSAIGYLGEGEAGVEHQREGLRLAREGHDHDMVLRAMLNLSDLLETNGDHVSAEATAMEAIDYARRNGRLGFWWSILAYNLAEVRVYMGRWDEAEEALLAAMEIDPPSPRAINIYQLKGTIALLRGDLAEAQRQLDVVRKVTAGRPLDFQEKAAILGFAAGLHHATGDLAGAGAIIDEVIVDFATIEAPRWAWPSGWLGMRIEADAAALARDRGEPFDLARTERIEAWIARLSEHTGSSRGYRAFCNAERARVDGRLDVDLWSATVEAWRPSDQPFHIAYALVRLGEAELDAGRRAEAAEMLRESVETAAAIGAAPVAEQARSLAKLWRIDLGGGDGNGKASERPVAERFGLTEREQEILQLVADGRSNGQIAEVLFISPKTASVHVSNIIRKLGVSGRVEAAALAHRQGLV
jgi:DNA-binding CsgD family transcriptional regulator/tetratricopeptide (TPR) repeat protein